MPKIHPLHDEQKKAHEIAEELTKTHGNEKYIILSGGKPVVIKRAGQPDKIAFNTNEGAINAAKEAKLEKFFVLKTPVKTV